jgi:hypothetical protein
MRRSGLFRYVTEIGLQGQERGDADACAWPVAC